MGPTCGRQDPGRPPVGPMNFVIWVCIERVLYMDLREIPPYNYNLCGKTVSEYDNAMFSV